MDSDQHPSITKTSSLSPKSSLHPPTAQAASPGTVVSPPKPPSAPIPIISNNAIDSGLSSTPPAHGFGLGDVFHRPRGLSNSTIRPTPASAVPVARVTSNPLPDTGLSSLASVGIQVHAGTRSRSASLGGKGRSVSPSRIRDWAFTWRKIASHRSETPLNEAPLTWWNTREPEGHRPWVEKRHRSIPPEQSEGWKRTRERVTQAVVNVLGNAGDITHEALILSAELLQFAPLPGLEVAAKTLLEIWGALQQVDVNRLACLRLTERCATILYSVREEIAEAGDLIGEELLYPIARLVESFSQVLQFMQKQNHRPFLKRYLKRDEIHRAIQECDHSLNDALNMFSLSIQIRILKQVLKAEQQRQIDTAVLLDNIGRVPRALPVPDNTLRLTITDAAHVTAIGSVDELLNASPEQIRATLQLVTARQNEQDLAIDTADMRGLMQDALQANNDVEMIRVLQVGRDEMSEAIKALQRALENEVERELAEAAHEDTVLVASISSAASTGGLGEGASLSRSTTVASVESRKTSSDRSGSTKPSARDTLDREFIETGIDALRRLSTAEVSLPSWTITRYEVDREQKIGIGFFSDVYKGTWQGQTVAIKVLAETTPRELFVHEVTIWKELRHPNVLELLGASSTSVDPPWFFVSPYYKNGSMISYLKNLPSLDSVDPLKMVHEIAKGMAYLHSKGVLHGDLKGANVLVDDRGHCVLADFGQSEMKSEVYRVSGQPFLHGTLRWQAPELMAGQSGLTPEIDVYAFAMCCMELLTKGGLPWPLADDDAVRHFVLRENKRPEIPILNHKWTQQLSDVIHMCWHRDPALRPSFAKIVQDIQHLRRGFDLETKESPMPPAHLATPGSCSHRPSPDMRPVPLPPLPPDTTATFVAPGSTSSSDTSYLTAHGEFAITPSASDQLDDPFVPTPPTTSRASSTSSEAEDSSSSSSPIVLDASGYQSPIPGDERAAEIRNERRYRMLIQHEYHPSLTLPLWTPSQVALGAVGYLSKPHGEFVTLFNAFRPADLKDGSTRKIPSLEGFGRVSTGTQRQDKRSVAQRATDMIQSWLTSKSSNATSMNVSRRYSAPLRLGHKTAHLFTESTAYRYIETLETPKAWFKANVDAILEHYGLEHQITREDLYLVIGTLEAQDYALFVSHSHPDGQLNFNVHSAAKAGQPWGYFNTTTDLSSSLVGGPVYADEPIGSQVTGSKVSQVGRGGRWDTVLVARLRFTPDSSEPTSR